MPPLDGECIKQDFYLIKDNPIPNVPTLDLPAVKSCCGDFVLHYLADENSEDELKNDVVGPFWLLDPAIETATLTLQKHNGSDYADIADLDDNTYGTFHAYGSFVNSQGKKLIGYQLELKEVLTAHGAGGYRVKLDIELSFGGDIATAYWHPICLKQYTADLADGTVRIEYTRSGVGGDISDDKKVIDLVGISEPWYNSLRLPGIFGYAKHGYELENYRENNGRRPFITHDAEAEYALDLMPIAGFIHKILEIDFMMADTRLITDYNSINPDTWIQKAVIPASGYEPEWFKRQSKLAPVIVAFRKEYNNDKKSRY